MKQIIEKILEMFKITVNIELSEEELIQESYILTRDELDDSLLIDNFEKIVPNKELLVHFFMYQEYIAYAIESINKDRLYFVGIIRENKLIASLK